MNQQNQQLKTLQSLGILTPFFSRIVYKNIDIDIYYWIVEKLFILFYSNKWSHRIYIAVKSRVIELCVFRSFKWIFGFVVVLFRHLVVNIEGLLIFRFNLKCDCRRNINVTFPVPPMISFGTIGHWNQLNLERITYV